jgi:site-specific recombinase XerD
LRASVLLKISPACTFSEAAQRWLESRSINSLSGSLTARYIRINTENSYLSYIKSLELFFGDMPLQNIHIGVIKAYQNARLEGAEPFIRFRRPQDAKPRKVGGVLLPPKGKTPCPAKPKKVNQEINTLQQIMKRAGCWTEELIDLYEPLLEEEGEIPRALTPDEQRRWLDVSRMKERWNVIYWYSILAFSTCMSTDEIRNIRLGDMNLFQRVIVVQKGKVKARARTIELVGADVLWCLERLIHRAQDMGATEPQHFLFPWREKKDTYNPEKPMSASGIKKLWEEVRQASKITWFRMYDTRHTAITRYAEGGMPIPMIMEMAGHISAKMNKHYTHVSRAAMRRSIESAHQFNQASYQNHAIAAYRL